MTSDQFRADAELRTKAAKLLQNPVMQQMIEIVRRETPTKRNTREQIKAEVQAHVLLGAAYGYEMALDALVELTVPVPDLPEPLKETYGAEEYRDQL